MGKEKEKGGGKGKKREKGEGEGKYMREVSKEREVRKIICEGEVRTREVRKSNENI